MVSSCAMNFLARNLAEELLILRIAHQLQMVDCSCASQLQVPQMGQQTQWNPNLVLVGMDSHAEWWSSLPKGVIKSNPVTQLWTARPCLARISQHHLESWPQPARRGLQQSASALNRINKHPNVWKRQLPQEINWKKPRQNIKNIFKKISKSWSPKGISCWNASFLPPGLPPPALWTPPVNPPQGFKLPPPAWW